MKKINRIKRYDYDRSLITETLPYETPIVFSNDGLYDQVANFENSGDIQKLIVSSLIFGQGLPKSVNCTNPYAYKIRKNNVEFRRLALLHPASQWRIRLFYEKYEHLILHYCDVSTASIRAPRKIAGTFYSKSSWENINKYKSGAVASVDTDKYVKHTPSYFSYAGHDRLYKFFNSKDYFSLEKRFSVLKTLDVSKCFDSIYTHSLSWAVKDKAFAKSSVTIGSTFGQEFDEVIRHGNFNETNGIPIGPEVSRIFAEIIFQQIDRRAVKRLEPLVYEGDYEFRRYVDDVFVFARDENVAKRVYETYSDVLVSFNLHANAAKSITTFRPFVTTKSRIIYEAGLQANKFFEKFLEDSGAGVLKPLRVVSRWKLTKSYIDSVKSLCSYNQANYDDVASFLISVITERIKKIVNTDLNDASDAELKNYVSALEVLLEVIFFLYSVAPSVGASYKLSTSMILVFRFSKRYLPASIRTVSQHIYDLASSMLLDQCGRFHAVGVDGFVNLEYLNIVLAMRELGEFYLLPQDVLFELFIKDRKLCYFTIIACLFYVRGDAKYKAIRRLLIRVTSRKIGNLADVLVNSESAYLLLDLLSCPFVPAAKKTAWIKALHTALGKAAPTNASLTSYLVEALAGHAQVDWSDVDLLNSLEKKELKQAY